MKYPYKVAEVIAEMDAPAQAQMLLAAMRVIERLQKSVNGCLRTSKIKTIDRKLLRLYIDAGHAEIVDDSRFGHVYRLVCTCPLNGNAACVAHAPFEPGDG